MFVYKGLTRNMETVNTPVRVFSNIWKLKWDRDIKFDTNVSNKMFLNAANAKVIAFIVSVLVRKNQRDKKLSCKY